MYEAFQKKLCSVWVTVYKFNPRKRIQTFTQTAQYFHIFKVNDFVVTKGAKILYHLKNCRERLPGHRLNLIICLFKKEVPYLCLYSKKT